MKLKYTLSFLFSLIIICGFSQDEKAKQLVESIQKHTFNLKIEDGKFTGSGAEILLEAIPACQFLLIGEQHGIREVGQFSKVLFEEANASSGFQYMAIETDPFMAAKIQELAQGSVEDVKALSSQYPLAIPFYNNSDDFDFLKTVKDKSAVETTFWGLDQVFAAAPRYLFDVLETLAENRQAAEVAKEYSKKAQEGFNQAMSTGQMDKAIMNSLTKEDFEKLYKAFPATNTKAHEVVKGIEQSQEIYLYWFDGQYYNNNFVRSKLMKSQFMRYYNIAKEKVELPKVVFKFGANHMEKGLTPTNIFDIGNMVSEIAAMNSMESLHIRFTGAKGKMHNSLAGPQDFDAVPGWPSLFQEALKDKLDGDDWLIIDLRPLRHLRLKNVDPDFKRIIFNYDIWVIPKTAKPVSAF